MDTRTRQLLERWQAIEKGAGFQKAQSVARALSLAGYVLFVLVVLGLVYRFHPVVIAVAALVDGWVTAEGNALRTRIAQWPTIRQYIDWNRVDGDLNEERNR